MQVKYVIILKITTVRCFNSSLTPPHANSPNCPFPRHIHSLPLHHYQALLNPNRISECVSLTFCQPHTRNPSVKVLVKLFKIYIVLKVQKKKWKKNETRSACLIPSSDFWKHTDHTNCLVELWHNLPPPQLDMRKMAATLCSERWFCSMKMERWVYEGTPMAIWDIPTGSVTVELVFLEQEANHPLCTKFVIS